MTEPISFYFNIYKNEIYASRLVFQIRNFYPTSEILIISDGQANLFSMNQIRDYHDRIFPNSPPFTLIKGDRLKNVGPEFTQRNFKCVLNNTTSDLIIKLDPDSYIWRSFNYIPEGDWIGDVRFLPAPYLSRQFNFISGGCFGMRRNVIKEIYNSNLLLGDEYRTEESFYDRYRMNRKYGDPITNELIYRENLVLDDVANRLGVTPVQWDEVYCTQHGEQLQNPDDLKYAVTHPVRYIF
jgi:hypothetical protein